MATYEVSMPNGEVYEIEAPDDMPQAQIMARANALMKPAATPAPIASLEKGIEEYGSPSRGVLDNSLAGVGKAFTTIGRGFADVATDAYEGLTGTETQFGKDLEAREAEARRLDAPLMNTGAGFAGNIAGNATAGLLTAAIPGANTLTGAAILGAGFGAAQPTIEGDSRASNAALGAVGGTAGQALGNTVGRVIRPVRSAVDETTGGLLDVARREGIATSAADETGSKFLNVMDSVLDYIPIAGDMNAAKKAGRYQQWTKALFKQTGVDDIVEAGPAQLSKVRDTLSKEYDEILESVDINVESEDFVNALISARGKLSEFSAPAAKKAITRAEDLLQNNKVISGRDFKEVMSSLRDEIDGAYRTGKTSKAKTLKTVQDGFRDLWADQAGIDKAAALNLTDKRYAILKTIEESTTDGVISPKKMFNNMERRYKDLMKYGSGDQEFPDLARVGKRFVAENVQNSGTAQRQMVERMLTGGGLLGVASGAIPLAGVATAASSLALPMAAQKALWSNAGKNYFKHGLLNTAPSLGEGGNALLRGAGASLLAN